MPGEFNEPTSESEPDLDRLVGHLDNAEQNSVALQSPGFALDIDRGYNVQARGRNLRAARGDELVGHKVGLTSTSSQRAFGVDEPVSGYLMASTLTEESADRSLRGLLSPRVEVEIAFILDAPLSGGDVMPSEVLAATCEVALALEIVGSRWSGGAPSAGLLVADNVSAAGVVLGRRISTTDLDLSAAQVSVTAGGASARGNARNVYGHPAQSVAWLVAHLAHHGQRLEAGDIVLSGTFTTPLAVSPGDEVIADFGPLGRITTRFTD